MNPCGYGLISWDRVCDQCEEIQAAHDKASDFSEYGINFYEFIYTSGDDLRAMAERWWVALPNERRLELLREKEDGLTNHLANVKQEILNLSNLHT